MYGVAGSSLQYRVSVGKMERLSFALDYNPPPPPTNSRLDPPQIDRFYHDK